MKQGSLQNNAKEKGSDDIYKEQIANNIPAPDLISSSL